MGHLWWSLRIGLWPQDQPPHYIMAKLGQLYLQNGEAAPGDQLVASSWVQESETNQLAPGDSSSSMASVEAAQLLVPIIIDNLGDLTVEADHLRCRFFLLEILFGALWSTLVGWSSRHAEILVGKRTSVNTVEQRGMTNVESNTCSTVD